MQFIVFAAFAIVLSVPAGGVPWTTLRSPALMWTIVAGQILLPALIAGFYSRRVLVKLEREPAWLPSAQRCMTRGNTVIRASLVAGLIGSLYLTDLAVVVRHWPIFSKGFGLDEFALLLPFFAGVILSWIVLYPADRAVRQVAMELHLWASVPTRPVWSLGQFLNFMLRQHVLIIVAPMIPIVAANDLVVAYGPQLRRLTHLAWGDQVVLVSVAGLVFLVAPVMLRCIWHTRTLPVGPLRDRLENMARKIGLTFRDILIWESDGMVVNAAVMGIAGRVRYVMLSDGLLEMMDDDQIAAVFGHEAGHIKHHHIQFYLFFAVLSMLIVGGITELVVWQWPGLLQNRHITEGYLQVAAMGMIVLVWVFGFGAISRRFEWQADLFGAHSVTPPADACSYPCFQHGTAALEGPDPTPPLPRHPVCATGAHTFADALHRIAVLNGIPLEAHSWRHSSIANRIRLLRSYAHQPLAARDLERKVVVIKIILAAGVVIGLAIGVWLYWPQKPV